ncbi:MAG: hypothetical protein IJL83_05730 [Clostridia bacterium]|nr:hypothetical protein [Clostridia bacterium]
MTKNKTKKTILVSLVAMLVCVAMLTGVTYALFSKTVTSANNVITVSKYDVAVQWSSAADSGYAELTEADSIFKSTDADTTGLTSGSQVVRYIKLINNNSYDVTVNISIAYTSGETNTLAEYLKVYKTATSADTTGATEVTFADAQLIAATDNTLNLVVAASTPNIASIAVPAGKSRYVGIGFKVADLSGAPTTDLAANFGLTIDLAQVSA